MDCIVVGYRKMMLSRDLRRQSTATEKIAWDLLRDRKFKGYKFRRQHVVRGFILDFYCSELKLAIEIDGSIHGVQEEYDAMRQKIIELDGIAFIRITVNEFEESTESLFEKISEFLLARNRSVDLPLSGGAGEGLGVRS